MITARTKTILVTLSLLIIVSLYFYNNPRYSWSYNSDPQNTSFAQDLLKNISGCNCDMANRIEMLKTDVETPLQDTTCSGLSHMRGKHQKVVAFSLYESDAKIARERIKSDVIKENPYLDGIQINIDRIQEYYPGIDQLNVIISFCELILPLFRLHSSTVSPHLTP